MPLVKLYHVYVAPGQVGKVVAQADRQDTPYPAGCQHSQIQQEAGRKALL